MFNHLTIRKKLLFGFLALSLLASMLGAGQYALQQHTNDQIDSLVDETTPALDALNRAERTLANIYSEALFYSYHISLHENGSTSKDAARHLAEISVSKTELHRALKDYTQFAESEVERAYAANMSEQAKRFLEEVDHVISNASTEDTKGHIETSLHEMEWVKDLFEASASKAFVREREQFDSAIADTNNGSDTERWAGLLALISLSALAIGIGSMLSRQISRSLTVLGDAAEAIAKGDFSVRARHSSGDEIGDLGRTFNVMAENLQKLSGNLLAERNRLQRLLDSIADGVMAVDKDGRITLWNGAAAGIAGWPASEAMGRDSREVFRVIRERDRADGGAFIRAALIEGRTKTMENHTILIRKDGSEVFVGDSAAPIIDEKREINGVIVVFRDVSDEVKSQSIKTDFKYASHQMRTPLTQIAWNLELALDSKNHAKANVAIREALDASRSVTKMADQFLEVTEIDQDIVIPKYSMVNISDIIAAVFENFKIGKNGVRLSYEIGTALAFETDRRLIERIVFELVDNAVKFSRPKGAVMLSAERVASEVVVELHDDGIGIMEEQQPIIFTKFFRGGNYDVIKIPGAGLGLFICKSYTRLLGGKIWFTSSTEKGTSFFVKFPLTRA